MTFKDALEKLGIDISEKINEEAMRQTAAILQPILDILEGPESREDWTCELTYIGELTEAMTQAVSLARQKGLIK